MPDSATTPTRLLPFEGGCNFRDLGGYVTTDGARLRWRRLFRSGIMTHFTAADAEAAAALGIRCIVDLRRADERRNEPTRWAEGVVAMVSEDDAADSASLGKLRDGARLDPEAARQAMILLYQRMPAWLAPRLRALFTRLADDELPLLFNCAAGKDRTGFAAALLLDVLGVPRETVLADYLLTNEAVDLDGFLQQHRAAALGLAGARHPLLGIDTEVRRPMLAADADYLDAALSRIGAEHGSTAAYVRDVLGIEADRLARLRASLLET